jgi:ribonuclease D
VIDTNEKLAAFLPRLQAAGWIAVDTEADSLHAYPEKLCLIQVSIAGADELLDPLARVNLAPVFGEFYRHELIMHGADYDLRMLRKSCDFVPTAIFDTMLAGRLLGNREFGLANLLARYLGVTLEKGPQKANWARRPLTPRMEAYARNDTHHLKPLADMLKSQLREKGRLAWHQEFCARFIADSTAPRPVDPETQWRVKGSHLLAPTGLAVLRELWHWREAEAVGANRPPFFVLPPERLVGIASAAAGGRPWKHFLPLRFSHRRRQTIEQAVARGLASENPPGPLKRRGRRQTEAEKRLLRDLERRRNQRAAQLDLDPTLIASRSLLVQLAADWERHQELLMKWQRELLAG